MAVRSILATLGCTGLLLVIACTDKTRKSSGFGDGISPEALKAHLEFLADDALGGRGTGTPGHDVAAKYIAAQFAAAGLKGGMPEGGYYQQVPLLRSDVLPEASSIAFTGGGRTSKLKYGTDFLVRGANQTTQEAFSAPLVFVGYGVSAPELNYDDYAGLDVNGKVVAFWTMEAPSEFPPQVRAYYMSSDVKRQTAFDHGAVGLLAIRTQEMERRIPWKGMQRQVATGCTTTRWLDSQGRIHGNDGKPGFTPILNRSAAEALLGGEGQALEAIFATSGKAAQLRFVTGKTVKVQCENRNTAVKSANVVAVLEGSDQALKGEYVVFSTHIDHLGIGPVVDGDAIYNGAFDNASGCAAMLEIARAFARLPVRPRRSVIFAALTAEEQGLLGADYFAKNLPVPIEKLVANINLDGAVSYMPSLRDVIVHGGAHSSLGRTATRAAAETGFEISPDPFPDEGLFVRTDQFPFVKQGVPAVFLDTGVKSGQSNFDAAKARRHWYVTLYHSPKDDAAQKFDYPTGVRFARFAGLMGYLAAMDTERPKWNDGDFFGKRFARR